MIGRMPFAGFPSAALDFYDGLEADNSKSYWLAHKEQYDTAVREPMEALVAEVEDEFGPAKLFRPYRDVRFSADKTPYKTHQGAFIGRETGVGLYVQVSGDGLAAGGGFRAHSTAQSARFRAAIAADPSGGELEAIVATLRDKGFEILGEQVKTAPRGYAVDHPRIELLRFKELMVLKRFGDPAWLATKRAKTEIVGVWRALTPLTQWVTTHVGAG